MTDTILSPQERLHRAIKNGDQAALLLALDEGGDPNYVNNSNGVSALVRAIQHDRPHFVDLLLHAGARPEPSEDDWSMHRHAPPWLIAARYNNLACLHRLKDYGADPTVVHPMTQSTALHEAAEKGHVRVMAFLVEAGVPVHALNGVQKTALHCAMHAPAAAVELVRLGAGLNVPSAINGAQAYAEKKGKRPSLRAIETFLLHQCVDLGSESLLSKVRTRL